LDAANSLITKPHEQSMVDIQGIVAKMCLTANTGEYSTSRSNFKERTGMRRDA
jgi:hypothetical protein